MSLIIPATNTFTIANPQRLSLTYKVASTPITTTAQLFSVPSRKYAILLIHFKSQKLQNSLNISWTNTTHQTFTQQITLPAGDYDLTVKATAKGVRIHELTNHDSLNHFVSCQQVTKVNLFHQGCPRTTVWSLSHIPVTNYTIIPSRKLSQIKPNLQQNYHLQWRDRLVMHAQDDQSHNQWLLTPVIEGKFSQITAMNRSVVENIMQRWHELFDSPSAVSITKHANSAMISYQINLPTITITEPGQYVFAYAEHTWMLDWQKLSQVNNSWETSSMLVTDYLCSCESPENKMTVTQVVQ